MVVVFSSETDCLQERAIPKQLTFFNKHIPILRGFTCVFFCMAECNYYCYCYNMFVNQLITRNYFVFGFALSITLLIQGALYAFQADTISVLSLCTNLSSLSCWWVLASSALVESDNSVTINQLVIIRMSSYADLMSNTKLIYLPTNVARLCTHFFLAHAFYLLLLSSF